jgi:hypothetical protein
MHENSDFLRLVVNSIRKDLDANHEIDNCLALHAIANVGSSEMAEALSEDVHRLLISPCVQNLYSLCNRLIPSQDFSDFCQEESSFDITATISETRRSHTCR